MKTVLITGANKSIGFEVARQLAQQGYFIYLGSRDIEKGEQAVEKLQQEGLTSLKAVQIDIADKESVLCARQTIGELSASLEILINNAGISGGFPQDATKTSTEIIRTTFDTNFFGTIDVTQVFLDLLQKAPAPVIVNVTSGLASLTLHSDPTWMYYKVKGAGYGPSKTALNAYTIALAYELRDTPFKINVVDPGYTASDFNHHSGPGSIEDAAAFVAKYAVIGEDGPTGRFFSKDYAGEGNESPW